MSSKRLRKKRALPAEPLPPQVTWLENVSMEVTPLIQRTSYRRVDYLLTATFHPRDSVNSVTWHLVRSFDEFRFLRKRLVGALERGHFCQAECPWFYTFLKSYYPKSQLVGNSLSRVVARRRKTLTRSLATIRSFLLNRSNHVCSLVTEGVARELLEFVVGDALDPEAEQHGQVPDWLRQLLQKWRNGELQSLETSTSSDDTVSSDDTEALLCGLCEAPLVAPPRKGVQDNNCDRWDLPPIEPFSTLSCGHHFHDECLIEKLNEALKCPTCGHQEES